MAEKKNTSSKNDKRKSAEFVEEEIDKKSKPQKEKVPSDPSSVGNQIKTMFCLLLRFLWEYALSGATA